MKTIILTILGLALLSSLCDAQTKPIKHVFYDTVKTVKTRIDYRPDTIPCIFKEVLINNTPVSEQWVKGFVVWQTYRKTDGSLLTMGTGTITMAYGTSGTYPGPEYYKNDYDYSTYPNGKFLYPDYTPVRNPVIYVIKK